MAGTVYAACALTAVLCAFLLLRAYAQQRYKLLLWSGICFGILALNNFLLVVDKLVVPMIDLATLRNIISLLAVMILLFGMIWDAE